MSKRNVEKPSKQPVKKAIKAKSDDIDFSTISMADLKKVDAVQACKQLNIEQIPSLDNIPQGERHLFIRRLYMERVFKLQAYEEQMKVLQKEMTSGKYQNIDDNDDLTDDKKPTKSDKPKKKIESDSDNDSTESSENNKKKKVEKPLPKQKESAKKAVPAKKKKESSESDTKSSESEKKPVKGKAKVVPKKKAVTSESESESDSESEPGSDSDSVDSESNESEHEDTESESSEKKPVKKPVAKKGPPAKKTGFKNK
uniref:Uncharacterized protein n=1 Tax=viral metagenome TaxID=1070528 RepID=A0A6C0CAU4_9ZZZZ